jgi:flagellar hook-associated protein 3 FlgL
MRIAGDYSTRNLLSALNNTQAEQEKALAEISSGKRIAVASDDPAGMAAWLENRSAQSRNDEFLRSASTLKSILLTADSALNSVVNGLERAISLGVQGTTGTLSQSEREAAGEEVSGILDNVVQLANASFRGTYLFAGTNNQVQPFVADPDSASGWRYQGNSETTETEIADGRMQQMNVPGDRIFTFAGANVLSALSDLAKALRSGDTAASENVTAQLRAAFDQVSCQRVFYGNAAAQLETQANDLNSAQLELSRQENEIAGADQAESISRFLNAQNARAATVAAAGKISNLTLLDYLQ